MDTNHGVLCNGLRSLPKEIANLKKLEYLYIANSEIATLPAELAELEACTDIEIYTIDAAEECARMGQAKMFNTMILGGYLKVKPVVEMENVMEGLKKSLPERAWKLLPQNEEAIRHGGEIIKKR